MTILRKVENLEADSFKVVKIGEGSRFFQGGKTPVSNTRETLSMANQSKPLEFPVGALLVNQNRGTKGNQIAQIVSEVVCPLSDR